ncbi:hypothetical protein A6R68_22441, partial [Neotoma lepida]
KNILFLLSITAQDQGDKNPLGNLTSLSLSISVGESEDRLTLAATVLEELTNQKPVLSKARYSTRSFGIRRNEKIAVHFTSLSQGRRNPGNRSEGARLLRYWNNIGIQEHIDLGIKYNPSIGIYGLDVYVVL